MKKVFRAGRGARISNKDAKVVGPELEKIYKTNQKLTAEIVLDEAKKRYSPLHAYFTWDNDEAAGQWRLHQARNLIRSIEIEVVDPKTGKGEVGRAFVNVIQKIDHEPERVYVEVGVALKNPDLREQVLENALNEIETWKERYSQFTELAKIFKAVELTKRALKA